MKIEPLEVYATDCNYAVIKAPGRNFPGCVVQGDSLSILCRKVKDIVSFAVANQIVDRDFLIDVQELNNSLVDRLLHYQQVLDEHGIGLPYGRPFSENDIVKLVDDPE